MENNRIGVVIVGGGNRGAIFVDQFCKSGVVDVLGVVDINENAPGMKLAEDLNIPTSHDFRDFLDKEGLNKFIDVTGNIQVQEELLNADTGNIEVINTGSAELMLKLIEEHKQVEEGILNLNKTLIGLGSNFEKNINLLTQAAGEILGGTCALYSRVDKDLLHSIGMWNTPEGYEPKSNPEGQVCFDLVRDAEKGKPLIIKDLTGTTYFETDPCVAKYGLKVYIGFPVFCQGRCIGSLCVLFLENIEFDENVIKFMGIIAEAISHEEECLFVRDEQDKAYRSNQDIIENAPFGIYIVNEDGAIDYVNPAMLEIAGDTFEQFMGINVFTDLPGYQQLGVAAKIKKGFEGEYFRMRSVEYTSKFSDKFTIRNFIGIPLTRDDSRKVLMIVQDITEAKMAEREQSKQKELLDRTNKTLMWKIEELEAALNHIKRLEGLVPICVNCKKMRKEGGERKDSSAWIPLENYISERSEASFTHGLCPDCVEKMYGEFLDKPREE